jgi:hypothetical protein
MLTRRTPRLIAIVALASLLSIVAILASQRLTACSEPDAAKGGGVGDGVLHVFSDPERIYEAPRNPAHNYLLNYSQLYYFTIDGITEYTHGQTISVWACQECQTALIGNYLVAQDGNINFTWTTPNLPNNGEVKYKYGLSLTGPDPSWRFAKKTTHGVALTLIVPEIPMATLGSLSVFIIAYFGARRRRLIERESREVKSGERA